MNKPGGQLVKTTAGCPSPYLLKLPWPPSVNRLYRTWRGRVLLSKPGREYYEVATLAAVSQRVGTLEGRLAIIVGAAPPDKRGRDLDNLLKPVLDVLQKANIILNDSLIDDLRIVRMPPVKGGSLTITIRQQPGEG